LIVCALLHVPLYSWGASDAVSAPDLEALAAKSDAIVVAQLTTFSASPEATRGPASSASRVFVPALGREVSINLNDSTFIHLNPAGTYTLAVRINLKGSPTERVELKAPEVAKLQYGDSQITLNTGRVFLVFMKRKAEEWVPADPELPLVPAALPVGGVTKDLAPRERRAVLEGIVDTLVTSLTDPWAKRYALFFLSGIKSPKVTAAALKFLDDPDLRVQDHALVCLANNQHVDAIPKIANLEAKLPGTRAVLFLDSYRTASAVPFLNVLLLDDRSQFTRLNASDALNAGLADETSIPYLMIAMNDPEPLVAYQADVMLHRLVPTLGPPADRKSFLERRDAEFEAVRRWWTDRLSEKLITPDVGGAGPLLGR
jgi:hypothetical protein